MSINMSLSATLEEPGPNRLESPTARLVCLAQDEVRKGPSRDVGKLSGFMHTPMEIVFEVASQLEPLDLLHLGRVSKNLRFIFMSRGAKNVWRAARQNVCLPDCPPDMDEPEYASLVFDNHCNICGQSGAEKLDYWLRLRFCDSCLSENIRSGRFLVKFCSKDINADILLLLPYSKARYSCLRDHESHFVPEDYLSGNILQTYAYYKPEFDKVAAEYVSLLSDPNALRNFIEGRLTLVSQMKKHSDALLQWQRAQEIRLTLRRSEFGQIYGLIVANPGYRRMFIMPSFSEACWFPSVARVLSECAGQIKMTAARWNSIANTFIAEAREYQDRAKQELISKLRAANFRIGLRDDDISGDSQLSAQDIDETVLYHDKAIFRCHSCKGLYRYPKVLNHSEIVSPHSVEYIPEVADMALEIIRMLDLPANFPPDALEGRLKCSCDGASCYESMGLGSLIDHIVEENKWYKERWERWHSTRTKGSAFMLRNHHDLESEDPWVKIVNPGEILGNGWNLK